MPGPSENVDSAVVFASASLNRSIGFQPTRSSTKTDITAMPIISRTALMICTHVVASMPPKTTYVSMKMPVSSTARLKSMPTSAWMSTPAPTICAMR